MSDRWEGGFGKGALEQVGFSSGTWTLAELGSLKLQMVGKSQLFWVIVVW